MREGGNGRVGTCLHNPPLDLGDSVISDYPNTAPVCRAEQRPSLLRPFILGQLNLRHSVSWLQRNASCKASLNPELLDQPAFEDGTSRCVRRLQIYRSRKNFTQKPITYCLLDRCCRAWEFVGVLIRGRSSIT